MNNSKCYLCIIDIFSLWLVLFPFLYSSLQFDLLCCSSSCGLRMMVLPEVCMARVALDDLDSSLEMASSVCV